MEFFHRISLICLSGMFLSLTVSVILFVRLEIWKVTGYLTGSRAAREIRKLEQRDGEAIFREERMDETDVLEK